MNSAIYPRYLSDRDFREIRGSNKLDSLADCSILILGGTGMLGSFLVEAITLGLRARSLQPKRICVASSSGNFESIFHLKTLPEVEFFTITKGDIFRDFDYVIHGASPSNITKITSNEELRSANIGLLERIDYKSIGGISYLSSGEVKALVNIDSLVQEQTKQKLTRLSYPTAKLEGENYLKDAVRGLNCNASIIRLFHTFGPGVRQGDGRAFADFLWSVGQGKLPQVKSAGSQVRTYLYSLDAVFAIILAMTTRGRENIIEIGGETKLSILEFAKLVSRVGQLGGAVEINSTQSIFSHSPFSELIPDLDDIKKLGWVQRTDLEVAVSQTINWVRNETQNKLHTFETKSGGKGTDDPRYQE